jgi:predicted DNA-binding transcriptional regulator AlpA
METMAEKARKRLTMNNSPVLSSWKEIAQYLGKGVRTVQRWEQEMGLPVRRPLGAGHKKIVLARTSDLDTWMALHWLPRSPDEKKQAGDEMGKEVVAGLSDGIRRARDLREANHTLLEQMRALVQELMNNSYELSRINQDTMEDVPGNT